ncbi:Protein transport protein Sec24C [Branchiostoma belcheri]|nr:Protein transport protein Sec24C [Branchiostoma belcheri]
MAGFKLRTYSPSRSFRRYSLRSPLPIAARISPSCPCLHERINVTTVLSVAAEPQVLKERRPPDRLQISSLHDSHCYRLNIHAGSHVLEQVEAPDTLASTRLQEAAGKRPNREIACQGSWSTCHRLGVKLSDLSHDTAGTGGSGNRACLVLCLNGIGLGSGTVLDSLRTSKNVVLPQGSNLAQPRDKLSEEFGAYVRCAVLYTSVSGQRRLRVHNLSLNCCSTMATCAVLYTSVSGQRRLRVHNLSLNCCSTMADLYKSCEMDAIMNILSKQAVRSVVNSTPKAIREQLMAQCANILATYRKTCASPSSAGQLILPECMKLLPLYMNCVLKECMKLLPLYVNCVLKSDALQGGAKTSTDDRAWLMHLLSSMDISSSGAFFYPRLLPLHNLSPDKDDVPTAIRCSIERLKDNGVYLLENGVSMFMWIGMNVDTEWIQSVFGVQSVAQIDIDSGTLLSLDNPLSARVRNLVQHIRSQRSRFMKVSRVTTLVKLTIVRQRDKLEPWFQHFLVEDKGLYGGASYVDFLCHMHKEIRNLLS